MITRKSLTQPTRKPYESTTSNDISQRNPSQNSDSAADDQQKSRSQGTSDSPRDFAVVSAIRSLAMSEVSGARIPVESNCPGTVGINAETGKTGYSCCKKDSRTEL
jgi:hypothetical protein